MSVCESCRLVVGLVTVLTLVWIGLAYGQESNCVDYNIPNGIFTVCLSSNQRLAKGARPILRCSLTPDDTNACNFHGWQLNNSDLAIVKPNYQPLTATTMHGASFRIEVPSPAVAGIYECLYSCNDDSSIIGAQIPLPFFPSVEFTTPDNLVYWGELGTTITLDCSIKFYTQFYWMYENQTILPVHSGKNPRQELVGTSLTISDLVASDNNTYRCSAKSSVSTFKFISAHLFVYALPKILNISSTIETAEGDRTMMMCTAYAIPRPFIVWSRETQLDYGGRIQEETVEIDAYTLRSTLIITHTSSSDQGVYHCTAFNMNGTSDVFGTVREEVELIVEVPVAP